MGRDLTQGSILRTLVVFAVPIVLANLVQQLYGMIDLIIVGQFVGSNGTVGVATGGEAADIMLPVATALAGAGQVYVGQLFGAKSMDKLKESIGTLLTLMLVLSVVFSAATIALYRPILNLLNCPAEAFDQATAYMIITALGLPFVFGYNAICSVLRGMGESKRPLMFIIIAATVNIFANLLLVVVIPLEAAGVAIATVLSQLGSFLASFLYLYKRREEFGIELRWSYLGIKKQHLMIFLRLGIPKMVQSFAVSFSMLWVSSQVNAYGLVASATNSVGHKIQRFCNVFVVSVDTTCGALIAQNLGARKTDRARRAVLITVSCTMGIAVLTSSMALLIPRQVFGIFTTDPEVIEFGVVYMRIMVITFFTAALSGPFQAMITGAGFASLSFFCGLCDGVFCRVGFSILFAYVLNMEVVGFFLGHALARSVPALIGIAYFASGRWKTRKLLV